MVRKKSRTQVNKSTYAATPRTATVGTATANPAAAAAINSSDRNRESIDQWQQQQRSMIRNDPVQAAALAAQQAPAGSDPVRQQWKQSTDSRAATEQAQQQAQ